MPKDVRAFLDSHLISIGGTAITPGSVLLGALVIILAIAASNGLAFSVSRLVRSRGGTAGAQFAIGKMVRYGGTALGFLAAVNAMGVHLDALLAASTVLAVGIGFGLQNIAQNFISGLILLVEQPGATQATSSRASATSSAPSTTSARRATHVVTRDEVTIIVPNSALITIQVINHFASDHEKPADLASPSASPTAPMPARPRGSSLVVRGGGIRTS